MVNFKLRHDQTILRLVPHIQIAAISMILASLLRDRDAERRWLDAKRSRLNGKSALAMLLVGDGTAVKHLAESDANLR